MSLEQIISGAGIAAMLGVILAARNKWISVNKENAVLHAKIDGLEVKDDLKKIDEKVDATSDSALLSRANERLRRLRGSGNSTKGK